MYRPTRGQAGGTLQPVICYWYRYLFVAATGSSITKEKQIQKRHGYIFFN